MLIKVILQPFFPTVLKPTRRRAIVFWKLNSPSNTGLDQKIGQVKKSKENKKTDLDEKSRTTSKQIRERQTKKSF